MPSNRANFFYFGMCHFCKSGAEKLKRCSSCRTVSYCSREHQAADWEDHKRLCKAIAQTWREFTLKLECSFEDWKRYRLSCQNAWVSKLQRQLEPYECQMWMFPFICNVCYLQTTLFTCNKCKNVAYCSSDHEKKDEEAHAKFCTHLKLCMDVDTYLHKTQRYPELELQQKSFTENLPEDISKLLDVIEVDKKNGERVCERVLKADALSPGAIILYALKLAGVTQFRLNRLVLHLVGSSAAEGTADWRVATELIFHWLKGLKEIQYIFVGPEAWNVSSEGTELCQTCKNDGRMFGMEVLGKLYHEVVDSVEQPNLVVSFNSGLHEFEGQDCDNWQKSIPVLVKNEGVPFVFTSYTEEEMVRDLQRIRDIADPKTLVLTCGKNPFGSLRPIRDWCTEGVPVFYPNGYISIVKRQKK